MKVVIDTNVLLVSLSSKSPYHIIFSKIITGETTLVVSNEIILEYEEIISNKMGTEASHNLISFLKIAPNVILKEPYFKWGLITSDIDDNKFVDLAICEDAEYLVTNDKSFKTLSNLQFPKVDVINARTYKMLLKNKIIKTQF